MNFAGKRFIFAAFIATAIALFSSSDPGFCDKDEGLPILIDTDMGLDDVRAVYALIASERLDIHGLLTVEGSSSVGRGTDNLIGMLETYGIADIDLYKGKAAPGIKPPVWRDAAQNLAGFPPPRELKADEAPFEKLRDLLESRHETFHYLALGPLTNLAYLEKTNPGALEHFHTVWIPVRFNEEGKIKDWNLVWDISSAETVLTKARRIVLIDLNSVEAIDAGAFLGSVGETSCFGEYIVDALARSGQKAPHLMIYDELAAAALIRSDLIAIGNKPWTVAGLDNDCIRLSQDENGNILVATFTQNKNNILSILKDCWEKPMSSLEHDHDHSPTHIPPKTLMKAFHGHLGPYVVLGYRMSKLALDKLNAGGHFDVSAEVYTVLEPPCSCIIDGIQLGSGCTLGKRNIEAHPFDGPAYAVFSAQAGAKVSIRLKPEVPGLVASWVDAHGVEKAGELFLESDPDTLFIAEILTR